MDADEAEFSVQAELENQVYKWADKYKPRKPRFFNRVHTGYEWNKYNQTHYDFDNPPPKIVQGYKINVFYPDLIDKSISPDFKLSTLKGKLHTNYVLQIETFFFRKSRICNIKNHCRAAI